MASAARRQIIGSGVWINKSWRRHGCRRRKRKKNESKKRGESGRRGGGKTGNKRYTILKLFWIKTLERITSNTEQLTLRGHPFMTTTHRGEGMGQAQVCTCESGREDACGCPRINNKSIAHLHHSVFSCNQVSVFCARILSSD